MKQLSAASYIYKGKVKTPTVTANSNKTTSKTIKSLKGGKKYYVRVRTFKKVGKTKYYSAWSSSKSATA